MGRQFRHLRDGQSLVYTSQDNSGAIRAVPFDAVAGTAVGRAADLQSRFATSGSLMSRSTEAAHVRRGRRPRGHLDDEYRRHGLRNVTNDAALDRYPQFAPDSSIVFFSDREGGQIWTFVRMGMGCGGLPSPGFQSQLSVRQGWPLYQRLNE